MCVAMPGRVRWIGDATPASVPGEVEFEDRIVEINLVMVPDIAQRR